MHELCVFSHRVPGWTRCASSCTSRYIVVTASKSFTCCLADCSHPFHSSFTFFYYTYCKPITSTRVSARAPARVPARAPSKGTGLLPHPQMLIDHRFITIRWQYENKATWQVAWQIYLLFGAKSSWLELPAPGNMRAYLCALEHWSTNHTPIFK